MEKLMFWSLVKLVTMFRYYILNTKFTEEYAKSSPVSFYDEITRFWQAFENKTNRTN